jgi:hypothetical protein
MGEEPISDNQRVDEQIVTEETLGLPRPQAPMPPWKCLMQRPLVEVDTMIRRWFSINTPERTTRATFPDGTIRYFAKDWPDQEKTACVFFIRPLYDDCVISVEDIPENLEDYNDLIKGLRDFYEPNIGF